MSREQERLSEARDQGVAWKQWGPYLSERQWGTVREDYSDDGNAWDYFTHDQARSRAYRWGEDGLGGIAYMVRGNMCIGVSNDRLMVRVRQDAYEEALAQPHVQVMDFTGRPMRGYVYVTPARFAGDVQLDAWVQRVLDFNRSLPQK